MSYITGKSLEERLYGQKTRETFTATGGQTVFNLTKPYFPFTNTLSVYVNGVRALSSEYAENSNTVVTFVEGLVAGDLVEFVVDSVEYNSVSGEESFLNKTGGTMTGDLILDHDPVLPLEAATKQYVDGVLPDITGNALKLLRVNAGGTDVEWGDTMAGSGGSVVSGDVVLTASSPAMQSVTPTAYGQVVTLPDATTLNEAVTVFGIHNNGRFPISVNDFSGNLLGFIEPSKYALCSLSDNSSSAGVWDLSGTIDLSIDVYGGVTFASSISSSTNGLYMRRVVVDSNRTLFLISGNASMHAVVYDSTTRSFGSPILVRASNVENKFHAILQTTDQVLVVSCPTGNTTLEARILVITGSTITLGAATASATLAGNIISFGDEESNGIVQVGSSFLISYTRSTTVAGIRAITVTGTTPTIGAETSAQGTGVVPVIYNVSGSVVLVFSQTSITPLYATCYTISGTTITLGGSTSVNTSELGFVSFDMIGYWALIYRNSGTVTAGTIISVSGTVPSASNATLVTSPGAVNNNIYACRKFGQQILVTTMGDSNALYANVLTNTAGTASAGVQLSRQGSVVSLSYLGGNASEMWIYYIATKGVLSSLGISGNDPVFLRDTAIETSSFSVPSGNTLYKKTGVTANMMFSDKRVTTARSNTGPRIVYNGVHATAEQSFFAVAGEGTTESQSKVWCVFSVSTNTITRLNIARLRLA